MKKRVMTFLLAVMLMCNMVSETLYATDDVSTTEQGESAEGTDLKVYTLTFDMAGGCTAEGDYDAFCKVEEGTLPDADAAFIPVRTGYLFQGWKNDTGDFYFFDEPVWSDMTLTASWLPITYHVRFDANGGSGTVPGEMVINYDEVKRLPVCELTKKGYVFAGWTSDNVTIYQGGTNVKNLTNQKDETVVLKAVWAVGKYQVQFVANGGTGSMADEVFICGMKQKLTKNGYKRKGYKFDGWNTKSDGTGVHYNDMQEVASLSEENGTLVLLYAMWKGNPYQVTYHGNGADSGHVPNSSHVYGTGSKLCNNTFQKKGYTAAGWSTRKNGKGKVYKSGAVVTDLTTKRNKTVTLYARWKATKYKITYDCGGGRLSGSAKKSYTIKSKTFTLPTPKRSGYDFDGWYTDRAFRIRVGEIKTGRTGDITLYAKWVRCSGKVSKKAVKLTSCRAIGTHTIFVQANIKKRVASSDDYYYLVYVDPISNKAYKMAERTYKKSNRIYFSLNTSKNQGYVMGKFGIAVKKGKKYRLISNVSYVSNPERAAGNKSSYKAGKTKKGIQFSSNLKEVYDCNAKQTFLNITAEEICLGGKVPYEYNGKTYYFNSLSGYQEIVKECNRKKINVTMQILLNRVKGRTSLICASGRKNKNASYYMWNVFSSSAREEMEAIFSYLGKKFGMESCYVSNWVLGNEINNPMRWNYAGRLSDNNYFTSYAYAFRALYYAVRSQYANAHIFICTDNLWNVSVPGGYSVKTTISSFKKHLDFIQKGLRWNLAYHAYSNPPTHTNFWNGIAVTNDENSPYVTMKNLNVLTDYIKKNYGSSVRVILSEQGYSSTGSQTNQAAALAYSYYIAACNPMVDAFIIRSYSDHPVEIKQGLRMGIKGKEAFSVFKYMDTSNSAWYTKKYLKIIRARSWEKIVPGFKKSRIIKMYRKT